MVAAFAAISLTPTVAHAAGTAQFNVSAASGRPGIPVTFTQQDPCPAIPAGDDYQDVEFSFTDANGVVTTATASGAGTDANGNWSYNGGMYVPYRWTAATLDPPALLPEAALGTGWFNAKCVLSDGTVSQEYAPQPFNVTGGSYAFTASPTTVQPGADITVTSVDPCPGDRVQLTLLNTQIATNVDVTPDANGAWSVTLPASYSEMDGTVKPYQPGPAVLRAYCFSEANNGPMFGYADLLMSIGNSTPSPNCKDVGFFAVAGSGEYYDGPTNLSISPEIRTAYDGFKKVLTDGKKIRLRVINYPALPVETVTKQLKLNTYLTGKNAGVRQLRSEVTAYRNDCPGKPIVLAGYSQGALAVHEFMVEYARVNTGDDRQAITAAITIADPAQIKNSPVLNFGTAPTDAEGICQFMYGTGVECFKDETFGDIPQVYRSRTTAVCNQDDLVCDTERLVNSTFPLPGAAYNEGALVHQGYANDLNVTLAGKRAARQVNNRF